MVAKMVGFVKIFLPLPQVQYWSPFQLFSKTLKEFESEI